MERKRSFKGNFGSDSFRKEGRESAQTGRRTWNDRREGSSPKTSFNRAGGAAATGNEKTRPMRPTDVSETRGGSSFRKEETGNWRGKPVSGDVPKKTYERRFEVGSDRRDDRRPIDRRFEKGSDRNDNRRSNDRRFDKSFDRKDDRRPTDRRYVNDLKPRTNREPKQTPDVEKDANLMRLNRYIANSGVCSRRDADKLILNGDITVNNEVVKQLGVTVSKDDVVKYQGRRLNPENKVYILLNKPKDVVTTLEDPEERATVMDLLADACTERIYPVGRLDRMTTGLLLLTNDGDLAKKLTHPKYECRKIYHVFTDKPILPEHMEQIAAGVVLEDGEIKADEVSYVDPIDKCQAGIQLHSGRNRIVRRIFEHFGYQVQKLDRVYFAGLTKQGIPRGKWRFLTTKEVSRLQAGFFK